MFQIHLKEMRPRFVPLGFERMPIAIKANKFSILYIVNTRHDKTELKNQQL
jgi:hypothetical protein